ncbi:hypothetical protein K450DRAFT_268732 [Umbelopsis ramanniana AG]|uniref:Major facilitator superfamily (MFS) profile domain-containing protein n=1 Tax=Umbelopsis ramanniana AG TaxID=1314678 RepID=A0AAD5HHM0_UMBRA|nr:uncharacterized protein K450DRAFT_268732 [Umbelopsis ramanniana AG]KAI8583214.1 hypothetical protein K450DRAFT_268732 [Umbelopsis ramanniana AG]
MSQSQQHFRSLPYLSDTSMDIQQSLQSGISDTSTLDQSIHHEKEEDPESNQTSLMAWFELAALCALASSCSIMWLSFSVVTDVSVVWLNVDISSVSWLGNATALMYIFTSLITGWFFEKYGVKNSMLVGALFNMVGTWVRAIAIICPAGARFPVAMIGQCIASLGQPFVYNITTKFASVWFSIQHRGTANTILTIPFGAAVATLLIPVVCKSAETFPYVLVGAGIYSTIVTIPFLILPALPKSQPSVTAGTERTPFLKGCRTLFSSLNFWYLMIIFCMVMGLETSILTLLTPIMLPYGYTNNQAGIAGFVRLFSGFVAGTITGPLIDKTGQHLLILRLFVPLLCLTYVMIYIQILPNALWVFCMANLLNGLFTLMLLPVILELAIEITYPVSESLSTSVLWASSQIISFFITIIMDKLRSGSNTTPPNNMDNALLFAMILACVGGLPILGFKGKLRRLAQDKKNSDQIAIRKSVHDEEQPNHE